MSPESTATPPRAIIVGGGLAGLAAAAALAESGVQVELFEARRSLGGRATSFRDPASGQLVDHCQHVGMACCTNLAHFCARTGLADAFHRERVLHFFGPDGKRYDLQASGWLPAPLHLAPAMMRLSYLSWGDRYRIARDMWKLARMGRAPEARRQLDALGTGQWLRSRGHSQRAIARFWSVVLVSALSETVDRCSLLHARKVFVDGFMAARQAYQIDVPQLPLGELYGERLTGWLTQRGAKVHLGTAVEQVLDDGVRATGIRLADGSRHVADVVLVAVTARRALEMFSPQAIAAAGMQQAARMEAAPITGVHLWFDRPITELSHAVLIDRLGQWLFHRGVRPFGEQGQHGHYYQVVISASRDLAGQNREAVVEQLIAELRSLWPAARDARLLHWRMVSEQAAVFSVLPGNEPLRPPQRTAMPGLLLAGDWTDTRWPSTMEGAVRSGYLAAEAALEQLGRPRRQLVDDLPRGAFVRFLFGG